MAAEVVVAAPDPDLQRLCSGEDIPVDSISFLSCMQLSFDARGPGGTHNIWCYLFWLGKTSSGIAILENFHVAPRARLVILWLSGG